MKIAALIRVHNRPQNLDTLLDRLNGPLWKPFIHFNRLFDNQGFSSRARAAAIPQRVPVRWAGWSMVEATLHLMRAALRDPEITHLYLLSGQCYPLRTDAEIERAIDELPKGEANLLTIGPMPALTKPLTRLTRWHFYDLPLGPLATLVENNEYRLPRRKIVERLIREMQLYAGSGWWLFEREAVERMLRYLDQNRWFLDAFRWSQVPDEMFFQILTVALKIPVSGDSPTYDHWVQGRRNPEVVTPEILQQGLATACLFARKFEGFYPGGVASPKAQPAEALTTPAQALVMDPAFAFTQQQPGQPAAG